MFLVSLPCVVVLTIADQRVLGSALHRVQLDGTVAMDHEAARLLRQRWECHFRIANIIGQALGVVIGLSLAYFNYISYSPASTGF